MLAIEDFIADLNDQCVSAVIEPFAGMIGIGRSLLQDRVGRDHFARYQILADAEMLKRTLSLRAPELVGRDVDLAEAVHLVVHVAYQAPTCTLLRLGHFEFSVGPELNGN